MGTHEQLELLSAIIKSGPVYNSTGQQEAVERIRGEMIGYGWDETWVQEYRAAQLNHSPEYVQVSSFGDDYENDETLRKQNVVGIIDSGEPGPTLLLNGHYDVEPIADVSQWNMPWNSGEISRGRVWGRGATDMLGGLTSQLSVGSRFIERRGKWIGKIVFTAVTDEEIGGNGTLATILDLRRRGLLDSPDDTYCLIAEPSDRTIAQETLGFMHMKLSLRGLARHMAGALPADNALNKAVGLISSFDELLQVSARKLGLDPYRLMYNFGTIHGGLDAATPIDSLQLGTTLFYPPEVTASNFQAAIREVILAHSEGTSVNFSEFKFDGQRSPGNQLQRNLEETAPSQGIVPGIFRSPCDARLFDHYGITNVTTYGPGSLAQAHAPNEFIEVGEINTYNDHIDEAIGRLLKK